MSSNQGVERVDLDDGKIFHVKIQSHKLEDFRAFYAEVDRLQSQHQRDQPFRILIDFSQNIKSVLTPSLRQMAKEVARKHADIKGYAALLTPKSVLSVVMLPMHSFIEREIRRDQPHLAIKVFSDYDKALEWLRQSGAE